MPRHLLFAAAALCAASAWAQPAAAPVEAHVPWARPTVQGQGAGGVYVTLLAREPLTLVGGSSPAAASVEIHEMRLEGDVMRMRALESLALQPGKPLQLKPGGLHLMLQGLKAPLQANTSIPLTLAFRSANGQVRQLALQVPVAVAAPKEAAAGHAGHAAPAHKH